jgi:hypothetical protein
LIFIAGEKSGIWFNHPYFMDGPFHSFGDASILACRNTREDCGAKANCFLLRHYV